MSEGLMFEGLMPEGQMSEGQMSEGQMSKGLTELSLNLLGITRLLDTLVQLGSLKNVMDYIPQKMWQHSGYIQYIIML